MRLILYGSILNLRDPVQLNKLREIAADWGNMELAEKLKARSSEFKQWDIHSQELSLSRLDISTRDVQNLYNNYDNILHGVPLQPDLDVIDIMKMDEVAMLLKLDPIVELLSTSIPKILVSCAHILLKRTSSLQMIRDTYNKMVMNLQKYIFDSIVMLRSPHTYDLEGLVQLENVSSSKPGEANTVTSLLRSIMVLHDVTIKDGLWDVYPTTNEVNLIATREALATTPTSVTSTASSGPIRPRRSRRR